jgi:two-component system, NtrC family, sensor kinase
MNADRLFDRYRELQAYVGWTNADALRIQAVAPVLDSHLPPLIDDFYAQIEQHPGARKVITGGQAQIERLKGTLLRWVRELLSGQYDESYVNRRWRVGWRHVEIGLDQVYTNVALSRLRTGLCRALRQNFQADLSLLNETVQSLNKLLDLDLAIIEEAYQAENASRLQRTERLATLGQVAGGVAHELRNPLNVVKTSVYYLLNARNPTPEKRAEHLCRIERQVDLADGVITTLSNFARMPVPALSPIAIEPCIRDALEAYPLGPAIRVDFNLPSSLPPVLADVDQLRIVFGNLIRNACDAMTMGGLLSIRGSHVNGEVDVAITDTGAGIPEPDLIKIQEPLYSTKAKGLGLGLAIVRAILDKSRGSLRVQSELGRGSTFTVRLLAHPAGQKVE